MSLPYAKATSGAKALNDIQIMLREFGCNKFASGEDYETGEVFLQFEYRGQMMNMKASSKGYAAAWLKANPWSDRRKSSKLEWESKAIERGSIAVYSVLRDWVKGQVTAIECGVLSFEAAFLSHLMLPSGKSMLEHAQESNLLALDQPSTP